MNFTEIFIRRPVLSIVLSLLLLLVGGISYTKLSVRQYPKINDSVISITTSYSGASAQLIESFITSPIEKSLSGIDGVDFITSSSSPGQSQISVHFNLGYDLNTGLADVTNKVQSARWELPRDINDPVVEKRDPNMQPTLFMAFRSNALKSDALTDYLNRVVQPQIGTLPGVAQSMIFGGSWYAMRIWLNPYLMAAHDVTANDVASALENNNQQSPTGSIKSAWNNYYINALTDLSTAQQFSNLVVLNQNGHLIRIKDIGSAELGPEDTSSSVVANGRKAVIMAVVPQPTANPLEVSNVVNKTLVRLKQQLPADVTADVVWDSSKFIAAAIKEVKHTVIEATIAVILVMFLFLGSLRVLAIPAVTIPLSLISVCALMLAMGFSINTLTLLAMVLAIGIVVDDSIVVTENIHRHLLENNNPIQAAIIGAKEIQFAVIAMTCTLAAVFAPIGFLTDITGALFKEFAFSLAAAVIVSGFIALTLSPMMCSKIMKPQTTGGRFSNFVERILHKIVNGYRFLLTKVTNKIIWVWLLILVIAASVVFLYTKLPQELAPSEDMGAIMTMVTAPPSANLQYTEKYTKQLEPIFNAIPEKESYVIINGMQGENSALSFIVLKPWDQRKRTVPQIIQTLFPQLWAIAGVQAFPVNPFRLPGSNDYMPVKFVLKTTGSYQELESTANKLVEASSKNPGLVNVSTDLNFDQPQFDVNIDRNKAADMGIPMSSIGQTLSLGLSQPLMGHFEMHGESYDVIPQLAPQYMNKPDAIDEMEVRTASGQLIPLSNIVKMNEITAPANLPHFQQQRAVTLTASLAPGYSLGQALTYLETTAKKIMPSDTQYDFSGTSRQFIEASHGSEQTFIFALIFIFLILAAQFESFLDPFIVLFSVIPAIAGALIALKLFGGSINIYTQIGLVTLIGLISKHGILIVEFANQLREKGAGMREAIIESACIRFRPIVMTTASMILGALPLALATGAGAISRQQMGDVIVGGMLFGTCITLFVVPTAYITINNLANLFNKNSSL